MYRDRVTFMTGGPPSRPNAQSTCVNSYRYRQPVRRSPERTTAGIRKPVSYRQPLGEYCGQTPDGEKYFVVIRERPGLSSKYAINRLTDNGHIVIEERTYETREEAKGIVARRLGYSY